MMHGRGLFAAVFVLAVAFVGASPGAAAPEGQVTWAVHGSLAPTGLGVFRAVRR